ncbi:MAG: spermidine/putrescine ABC transporter substrate-binding protein [Clostridia bacterium]|nr:spermidine/putrescine ABC transporter substrate-binding protein [Clostridia bacterium]
MKQSFAGTAPDNARSEPVYVSGRPSVTRFLLSAGVLLLLTAVCSCSAAAATDEEIEALRGTTLYVYNWGEYISDGSDGTMDVNAEFEKKYGIKVVYDTFDNNEVMYAKLKGGGISYDVVFPSDYMIGRMINEDLLEELDFGNIPNYKYIDERYRGLAYDPENRYSVPYNVGMVGLIYNTKAVTEPPTSWKLMWNSDYAGKIVMFNNPRDAFAIAQSILDIDFNTLEEEEWRAAADLLCHQKQVLQSYVNDEIFDKMESGEAVIGAYYAGDYLLMYENNEDLAFVYPDEGVNVFVDAACVLKGTRNKLAAELYINFLQEPDVALANAEYICYASPNVLVINDEDYEYYQNEILYPDEEHTPKTEIFLRLPDNINTLMNSLWEDVKNYDAGLGGADAEDGGAPQAKSKDVIKSYAGLASVALIGTAAGVGAYVRRRKRERSW